MSELNDMQKLVVRLKDRRPFVVRDPEAGPPECAYLGDKCNSSRCPKHGVTLPAGLRSATHEQLRAWYDARE